MNKKIMSKESEGIFDKIINLIDKHIKSNYFLVVLGVVSFLFLHCVNTNTPIISVAGFEVKPSHLIIRNNFGLDNHKQNDNQNNRQDETQNSKAGEKQGEKQDGKQQDKSNPNASLHPSPAPAFNTGPEGIYSIFFFVLEILLTSAAIVKILSIINIERILETCPVVSDLWYGIKLLNYENRVTLTAFNQLFNDEIRQYQLKLLEEKEEINNDIETENNSIKHTKTFLQQAISNGIRNNVGSINLHDGLFINVNNQNNQNGYELIEKLVLDNNLNQEGKNVASIIYDGVVLGNIKDTNNRILKEFLHQINTKLRQIVEFSINNIITELDRIMGVNYSKIQNNNNEFNKVINKLNFLNHYFNNKKKQDFYVYIKDLQKCDMIFFTIEEVYFAIFKKHFTLSDELQKYHIEEKDVKKTILGTKFFIKIDNQDKDINKKDSDGNQLYKVNFVIYKYLEIQNNGGWGKHIFKTLFSFWSFFVAGGLLWCQGRYFNNFPPFSWSETYQNLFYIAEFFTISWLVKKICRPFYNRYKETNCILDMVVYYVKKSFKFIKNIAKNTNEKNKTKSA